MESIYYVAAAPKFILVIRIAITALRFKKIFTLSEKTIKFFSAMALSSLYTNCNSLSLL